MLEWGISTLHALAICISIEILFRVFCKEKIKKFSPNKPTFSKRFKTWIVIIFMCSIPVFRWFVVMGLCIVFLILLFISDNTLEELAKENQEKSE